MSLVCVWFLFPLWKLIPHMLETKLCFPFLVCSRLFSQCSLQHPLKFTLCYTLLLEDSLERDILWEVWLAGARVYYYYYYQHMEKRKLLLFENKKYRCIIAIDPCSLFYLSCRAGGTVCILFCSFLLKSNYHWKIAGITICRARYRNMLSAVEEAHLFWVYGKGRPMEVPDSHITRA